MRASCVTMAADSNAWRPNGEEGNAEPSTKEELRMLKTLTREKTKMVIARKLKRGVDAMYGLASKLGVLRGETEGGKRRGE